MQSREELEQLLEAHGSFAAVARHLKLPRTTIVSRYEKHGIRSTLARSGGRPIAAPEGITKHANGTVTLIGKINPTGTASLSPEDLLRQHGMDPEEFEYSASPNAWDALTGDGSITTLAQLKIHARPRVSLDLLIPPRTDAALRKAHKAKRPTRSNPLLVALPADQHCPQQDRDLEACWLAWVRHNQPGRILGLGDLVNLSKPSRHRQNLHEKHNDTVNECTHEANAWWRRTLEAAPDDVEAGQLPGNHCLRLQIGAMERYPDAYEAKRPGEEHPWWDFEYMVGLDKLGVVFHRPEGEYHAVEVELARGLAATHGSKAGPHGGAIKAMSRHEGSRIVGHDHKSAILHVVRYRDGEEHVHVAVSGGTMSKRDLGYQEDPDAQQGFATATIHSDGTWNVELARYDSRTKTLYWRDQVYRA